ncbi:MAG: efflux RND transporter permease subunit [Planctomycetota bacterium]
MAPPSRPVALFDRLVLGNPRAVVLAVLLVTGLMAAGARHFRLDASAETLVLENDRDLHSARQIQAHYGEQALLVLGFTPVEELFSDPMLAALAHLRNELEGLGRVDAVRTILDVPLIASAPSLQALSNDVPTLESTSEDRTDAARRLQQSAFYRDLLISADGKTTALLIFMRGDEEHEDLLSRRDTLQQRLAGESASQRDRRELRDLQRELRNRRDLMAGQRHEDIVAIRSIMERHTAAAQMFLGGTGMIADDMITFIKSDLRVFGLGVVGALALSLGFIFQRIRWVALPLLCCLMSVSATIGLLGWLRWDVTVISVNFISLQLIMTMALAIHLVVQYRELHARELRATNRWLVREAVRRKFKPCVYATLTTIAGFGSLLLCDIQPVIVLGRIMTIGLVISLPVAFLMLPSLLVLLPKPALSPRAPWSQNLNRGFARLTEVHGSLILVATGLLLAAGLMGARRLEVENRFIDYFRQDTEIHQGMKVIDEQLGGTTPLDVLVNFGGSQVSPAPTVEDVEDADFDEFSEFDASAPSAKYWFTERKLSLIRRAHRYLEGLPETGKVLSLATALDIAEKMNDDQPLDSFDLALLYSETPDEFKALLVEPYASVERDQARLRLRVRDSDRNLRRNELLKRIEAELPHELGLGEQDVELAGLLVLYNNMLQSLYGAQVMSLGLTMLLLSAMLLLLFRSWRITLLALIPNMLPVVLVLGIMGWGNLPLDMMTITIAAIGVSIAVDDTVHYVHRFQEEGAAGHDWITAMHRSHGSVGLAMTYTTTTITTGFAILALSSFAPTVYFGLLTALAMIVALVADLTLLPRLLILARPFAD